MPQPECWPRCAQAPVYSLPSAVLVRHALRHDSTTGALHRGPWSYQYASEGEITRLSPNFVFNRGDFIEGRKWAMRLARSRHALAAFGAETALQGHPFGFGRIAARAVSERIAYGTSDVGRPGSPGCLRFRSGAGDDDAGRAIGACPDSTGAKRPSASPAQGQGSSRGAAATKSCSPGRAAASTARRAAAHLLAVDQVLSEGPGSQCQAGVLYRQGWPCRVRH